MLPFYAVMGIDKDSSNFNFNNITIENKNRKYRISSLDPMNSNIAFVLYECRKKNVMTFKLRVFQNENLIKTDGCSSSQDCNLDEFLEHFEKFKRTCGSTRSVCKL